MTYQPQLRKLGDEAVVFCNHSGACNSTVHYRIGEEYRTMASEAWKLLPPWDGGWPLRPAIRLEQPL
jgi:hypothetical protein